MNKTVKAILIISLCCFFLGIVVVSGCAAIAAFDPERFLWPDQPPERTYENTGAQTMTLEEIDSIDLNLIAEPIVIQIGGETPLLEWRQDYDSQYRIRQSEEGGLQIDRGESEWLDWGITWDNGFQFRTGGLRHLLSKERWDWQTFDDGRGNTITITLPDGHPTIKRLELNSISSKLTITEAAIERLSCNGTDNRLELTDCTIGRLSADTINGTVELTGGSVEKLSADGLQVTVAVDKTAIDSSVDINGLNARFEGNLLGQAKDYSITANGLNATLRIDGELYPNDQRTGKGDKKISIDGLNASLDVYIDIE